MHILCMQVKNEEVCRLQCKALFLLCCGHLLNAEAWAQALTFCVLVYLSEILGPGQAGGRVHDLEESGVPV